jgi:alpha-glucosidase (family GH31 glycosyl hydrolase)
MLGSEFLIAPVFEKDVKVVHVYLPEGTWVHVWSNQTYVQKNGGYINQNAPIKEPAVFRRVQQQDMMEEESEIMKLARETHEKLIDLYKIF